MGLLLRRWTRRSQWPSPTDASPRSSRRCPAWMAWRRCINIARYAGPGHACEARARRGARSSPPRCAGARLYDPAGGAARQRRRHDHPRRRAGLPCDRGPPGATRSAARIALRTGAYRPGLQADRLPCPILVQIADHDAVAPVKAAQDAAWRATGRAEVRTYPIGHFDIYSAHRSSGRSQTSCTSCGGTSVRPRARDRLPRCNSSSSQALPTFCRHNRFLERCPICSKTPPGASPGGGKAPRAKSARSAGSSGDAGRRPRVRGEEMRVRREGRAEDDGYRSELVPGVRASADALRLAEEIAFASGRLLALDVSPPASTVRLARSPKRISSRPAGCAF